MPPKKYEAFRNFIPFGFLVITAYVGLAEFRKINYTFKKNDPIIFKEQLKKAGMSDEDYQSKTTPSGEEELEKLLNEVDIDNWKNVRGPRPWENNAEYEEVRKKLEEKNKSKKST